MLVVLGFDLSLPRAREAVRRAENPLIEERVVTAMWTGRRLVCLCAL
jgi:hypothetical protein